MKVPFNRPVLAGAELDHIREAIARQRLAGDGEFTDRCQQWLATFLSARAVLLTHSCTAALEMAAILADIGPGDKVIMPSFTFVSTANAVVLRGGVPVFVDIRPDTLNIDENLVEQAVTPRTKAMTAGPLRRRSGRDGASHGDRKATGTAPSGGCGTGAWFQVPRPQGRQLRRPRRLQLPRDQEHDLRRGRRPCDQQPGLRRTSGDHPGERH